jgi:hypothetical protein
MPSLLDNAIETIDSLGSSSLKKMENPKFENIMFGEKEEFDKSMSEAMYGILQLIENGEKQMMKKRENQNIPYDKINDSFVNIDDFYNSCTNMTDKYQKLDNIQTETETANKNVKEENIWLKEKIKTIDDFSKGPTDAEIENVLNDVERETREKVKEAKFKENRILLSLEKFRSNENYKKIEFYETMKENIGNLFKNMNDEIKKPMDNIAQELSQKGGANECDVTELYVKFNKLLFLINEYKMNANINFYLKEQLYKKMIIVCDYHILVESFPMEDKSYGEEDLKKEMRMILKTMVVEKVDNEYKVFTERAKNFCYNCLKNKKNCNDAKLMNAILHVYVY